MDEWAIRQMTDGSGPASEAAIREKFRHVVLHMREAVEAAAREVERENPDRSLARTAARVNHIFVWAWANATVSLESSIEMIEERQRLLGHLPKG